MVTFDSETHTYYVNGKPREGVTHYIERHKQPFPKEIIAQKTAERDGREREEVLSEWELKGRLAREYGTAVHTAIEGYIKHGIIPQIPHLKRIVDELILGPNDLRTEYVTYNDTLAGTVDIVERIGKGKCNLYDIKTNQDLYKKGKKLLPPYEHLTDSPIDLYTLQLNLYADMMEYHGWVVNELNILHVQEGIKKINIQRL